LKAEIRLTISPTGEVVGRALTRSSGNATFDAAVQAALNSLTYVDPPPSGKQESFPFTFVPQGQ
jgi:TonB family protein